MSTDLREADLGARASSPAAIPCVEISGSGGLVRPSTRISKPGSLRRQRITSMSIKTRWRSSIWDFNAQMSDSSAECGTNRLIAALRRPREVSIKLIVPAFASRSELIKPRRRINWTQVIQMRDHLPSKPPRIPIKFSWYLDNIRHVNIIGNAQNLNYSI